MKSNIKIRGLSTEATIVSAITAVVDYSVLVNFVKCPCQFTR